MGDMQAWQQELELERMAIESAIVKRIEQGTATAKDAEYVRASFGLPTERSKHGHDSQKLGW